MKLRLVHTLSLLLVGAVLVGVAAMGALMAWNLRNGFADYLAARESERLEQFAALVAQNIERAGSLDALREQPGGLRRLLHEFALREGVVTGRPAPPRGEAGAPDADAGPPPPLSADDDPRPLPPRGGPPADLLADGPPPGTGQPPGGPEAFGRRVTLLDSAGLRLLGRPLGDDDGPLVRRPVRVHGQTVATAVMRPLPAVQDAVDARFLRRQYLGIVALAAALLGLALLGAWWIAGRWARPLLAVQQATARIARGEFATRLDVRRSGVGSDEIGDVVRNVNTMAEGLQRLESARRRWVADISHELRTPLAVLRGEIEALLDGVRPLHVSAVRSLQEEVQRLTALVDDLHLLAMSDLQALPCHHAAADAVQLAQRVLQRFERRAAERGLALRLLPASGHDGGAALAVVWDEARIEQLLSNLLENSLRYTDAPGHIELALHATGDEVVVTVDDSAPGVPAADLPRLFEPLYRAHAARSREHGGSGLGLAICEAIARAHGGRLHAAASALGGLRITVELPRRAQPS